MTTYKVLTWDIEKQKFTPQKGIRVGPHTLWGLRRVLRKLRSFGYQAAGDDPFVWIESSDESRHKPKTKEFQAPAERLLF